MSGTPIPEIIPGFHELSFMAGTNFAYSEAVGDGRKRLALSSPYSPDQLEICRNLQDIRLRDVEPLLVLNRI